MAFGKNPSPENPESQAFQIKDPLPVPDIMMNVKIQQNNICMVSCHMKLLADHWSSVIVSPVYIQEVPGSSSGPEPGHPD
jgi:hypothetical protein